MDCSASTSRIGKPTTGSELFLNMRIRVLLGATLVCSALCLGGLVASPALASHDQSLYFEGSSELLNPRTQAHAFTQMQALGVKALRVDSIGSTWLPAPLAKRPKFDATSPASYDWGQYDAVLAKAAALHWKVLLTVTAPVPKWATAAHKDYYTRPNARDFEEFMTAVGKHYGSEVSLFAIWNEPNDAAFLLPQFNSKGTPASPLIYRGLFQAGYAGLHASGITHPQVLLGETAPIGYDSVAPHKGLLHDVAPLDFLRGALCLNSHYEKAGTCGALPAVGYSHHAYTTPAGPYYAPPLADNVTIGVLGRLSRALDLAARAGAIKAGLPIYLTEFGVQSYPNRFLGVSAAKQAQFDAIAERIAYENPRVAAFSQYLLRDDKLGGRPGSSVHGGIVGFQTGLEYVNGVRKPLYYAFPVPLVILKRGGGFSLWGLARPATGPTKVTVLIQPKGSKRFRILRTVQTNSLGYWSFDSSAQGSYWRVRWISPAGVKYEGPPIASYKVP